MFFIFLMTFLLPLQAQDKKATAEQKVDVLRLMADREAAQRRFTEVKAGLLEQLLQDRRFQEAKIIFDEASRQEGEAVQRMRELENRAPDCLLTSRWEWIRNTPAGPAPCPAPLPLEKKEKK